MKTREEIEKLANELTKSSMNTNRFLFDILQKKGFEAVNSYMIENLDLEKVGNNYDEVKNYLEVNKNLLQGKYATKGLSDKFK